MRANVIYDEDTQDKLTKVDNLLTGLYKSLEKEPFISLDRDVIRNEIDKVYEVKDNIIRNAIPEVITFTKGKRSFYIGAN